jgi:hypothetical protein
MYNDLIYNNLHIKWHATIPKQESKLKLSPKSANALNAPFSRVLDIKSNRDVRTKI